MRSRRNEGFTLIELLIVIAIIGVLAAIAVPTLLNALERARQAQSVSIVMELGKSIERYIHDYPTIGAPRYDDVESLRNALNELELNLGDIKLIDSDRRHEYRDDRVIPLVFCYRFKGFAKLRTARPGNHIHRVGKRRFGGNKLLQIFNGRRCMLPGRQVSQVCKMVQ